ncbi:NAD-dependent protein deacylase [Gemella cuniculi]|uniref:NAD-dependent protein deacylase n=1 Tax=Gemella cuniculi TaxID=150240 RepID=UPI000421C2B1|nr:NAD-dependent protein deacylase [Gemella cuniculi]
MEKIEKLKNIIEKSNNIVFFGGAGVSTESNIPDFRSADGVYNINLGKHFTPEQLVSKTMFKKYPEQFFDFYKKHLIYPNAKPNKAHHYLAKLENAGKLKAIITQNIDTLHELAGSKNVLKIHGTVDSNYCTKCGKYYNLEQFLNIKNTIPYCTNCQGIIKPYVTLYEEELDMMIFSQAVKYVKEAEVLIIGGTSLIVYPAASLIQYFKGKHLVVINKSSTSHDDFADLVINEKIGEVFSKM